MDYIDHHSPEEFIVVVPLAFGCSCRDKQVRHNKNTGIVRPADISFACRLVRDKPTSRTRKRPWNFQGKLDLDMQKEFALELH